MATRILTIITVAVMFTFSFGSAFAITADEALAQALASAKVSAVQALNKLVDLGDYNADGQAEIKEIIEEGTDLINYQTDVAGVTKTLSEYQLKLIAVENANTTAVADAVKAATESIDAYIEVLVDSGCYAEKDIMSKINSNYNQLKSQATVVGVELLTAQIYNDIEAVKMTAGNATDAEEAKALANAKAAALKVVRGEADAAANVITTSKITKWSNLETKVGADTIESLMTKDQIAAYKAKVAEVVAAIKAAATTGAIADIIDREAAEVTDLLGASELAKARADYKAAVEAWFTNIDYAANYDNYNTMMGVLTSTEMSGAWVSWGEDGQAWVYANGSGTTVKVQTGVNTYANATVNEAKDVAKAVEMTKEFLLGLGTVDNTKTEALKDLKDARDAYGAEWKVDLYVAAEAEVMAAATADEVTAIVEKYVTTWRNAHMLANEAYQNAVQLATSTLNNAVSTLLANKTECTAGEARAAEEIAAGALAEATAAYNYDNFVSNGYDGSYMEVNVEAAVNLIGTFAGENNDFTYDYILAYMISNNGSVVDAMDKIDAAVNKSTADPTTDTAFAVLIAQTKADIANATSLTDLNSKVLAGIDKIKNYSAANAQKAKNIERYAIYKAAVAAVDALPALDKVTLNDKDAVVAAYTAFVNDGVSKTAAYCEEYPTAIFYGEAAATTKATDLYATVTDAATDDTLADVLADFNVNAYQYVTAGNTLQNEAQKAAIVKIYDDAVAAIKAAPQTDKLGGRIYANDIDYIVADALDAMANMANKYDAADLAALIADAKAFLGTCYDAADYSAEGLAKIAEIIAAVDGADKEAVAKATIAARKAIAAVDETLADQLVKEMNAKAYLQDLEIKARSVKTEKGIKVTAVADIQPLLDAGFTVDYKFYRSLYTNKKFGTSKMTKTAPENTYLNTSGKDGQRYYYKVVIVAKNAEGEIIAQSPLKHCLYATRVF